MADDKKLAAAGKKVESAFSTVADTVGKVIPGFGALKNEVTGMADTFQKLSETGNSFNNDMVGMRVAAANARMSLDEYAKVVQDNGKAFAGLGGSVSQGTKVFGEFSKAFFESNLTENLRQMGYTSKDLNELLSTQIGFQKATTDNTVEGQMRTAKAAAELGTELDLIAKLTGVSRREQEEKLKKAAVDGQVEAKFRLIGMQQGADAEKEARANYAKQLLQAQQIGQDQLFKEMFATGTATSKDAQMQLALLGESSMATAESAKQLSYAQIEASKASMESAKIANMQNQKNEALLTITAVGIGDAARVMRTNIEQNDAAFQGLQKFMKETNDVAEAMKKQRDAIEKEQKARNAVTELILTTQARFQDIRAGVATGLGEAVKKAETQRDAKGTPTGVLTNLQDLSRKVPGSVDPKTSNEDLINRYIAANKENSKEIVNNLGAIIPKSMRDAGIQDWLSKLDTTTLDVGKKVVGAIEKGYDYFKEINALRKEGTTPAAPPPVKREGGSIEMAGTLFENWGKGTLAELHGLEAVIKPDQMMNMAKGMNQQGAAMAFEGLTKSLLGAEKVPQQKGIDISKIASEIRTSISKVEITNWPKDMLGKVEVKAPATGTATKPAEQTQPKQEKKEEKKQPEEKKSETKEGEAQTRADKAAKTAQEVLIKSGDTLTSLAKRYGTSVAELMKANPAIKDANKIVTGAKLTIPGIEKKEAPTTDAAKKAQTEAEQAQIKQQEQEAKFREIGLFRGEAAEKQAREDYAKQQSKEEELRKWREDELKIRITGIREGADAAQKMRESLGRIGQEKGIITEKKTEQTKVTVDGKRVDPNSPEGQAVVKQMETMKSNIENSMGNMLNLTKTAVQDPARTNLQDSSRLNLQEIFKEVKNNQKTTVTVNGKQIDPNSPEGQAVIKQMESMKSNIENSMNGMINNAKTMVPDINKALGEAKKNETTKVTINGKDVDPNRPEGQAVIKQMESMKSNIENSMNGMINNAKTMVPDINKALGEAKKNETTKVTINGKDVDPNRPEGQAVIKQMETMKSNIENSMNGMLNNAKTMVTETQKVTGGKETVVRRNAEEAAQENNKFKIKVEQDYNDHWIKTRDEAAQKIVDLEKKAATETLTKREQNELTFQKNLKAQADEEISTSTANLEAFKNVSKEIGKAITLPLTDAKEEVKSNSEKIKEDMREALPVQGMRDKTEEMNKLAERRTEIEERLLERQGEVDGLKALASERALTEEEQSQLKLAENGVIRAQNNLRSNLEQQEELAAALGIAKKDSDSKILEQTKQANQAQIESVGGMTDAAVAAQSAFMQEINTLFDMPTDAAAEAQEALMQEANALFDMPSEAAAEAQEALMQEANALFDMPSEAAADAQDAFMQEANALFDIPDRSEFEEDEYGEGGDAIGGEMDSAFAEDEYSALEDLQNQIQGLTDSQMLEANEEQQGEGSIDTAFAEDEDDYVSQALKDFSSQLPETMNSMADDAAFAAGPGDASVAGIDYAEPPPPPQQEPGTGDASVAEAMASLQKTLPQAAPVDKQGPKSTPNFSKIDMGGFTLGPDGMPVAKPKVQAAAMASSKEQENKKKDEDKKATQASVRAADNKIDKDQADKKEKEGSGEKKTTKTLDDVVKSLDNLNSSVGRLITKTEEASKQQVQATKSLNGNLYNV